MSGSVSGEVKSEPNLTPILDMVFQLITFFVLIFNCKQAELASGVNLPVIGSARPIQSISERVIVFNFKFEDVKGAPAGAAPPPRGSRKPQIWVMGSTIPVEKIRGFVAAEAQSSMLAQRMTEQDLADGKELKDFIVIRADAAIPFRLVYAVINACQEKGFRQFSFKSGVPK